MRVWDMSNFAKTTVNKTMTTKERERFAAIIAMDTLVKCMNDENAYMSWIYLVPDCANEYDFIDFAANEDDTEENQYFDEAVALFKKLWEKYANEKSGLYIGEKAY